MNTDGMSRHCGQCQRPDCPVSAMDSPVPDVEPEAGLVDQPFASSEMGEPARANLDLIAASLQDATLATVQEWIQSDSIPVWAECAGLSLELRCWRLQVGNLSVDMEGHLWRSRARRQWALNW